MNKRLPSDKHKGKTLEQWIDIIIDKLSARDKPSRVETPVVSLADIGFDAPAFNAKNALDAIVESRGFAISSLNLLGQKFSQNLTIRQVIDNLIKDSEYSFNVDMLELFEDQDRPLPVKNQSEAINELLKMLWRQHNDIQNLKSKVEMLESSASPGSNDDGVVLL